MIKLENLSKVYRTEEIESTALNQVSFQIEKTANQDIQKISSTLHEYQTTFNKNNPDFQFDIYFYFHSIIIIFLQPYPHLHEFYT